MFAQTRRPHTATPARLWGPGSGGGESSPWLQEAGREARLLDAVASFVQRRGPGLGTAAQPRPRRARPARDGVERPGAQHLGAELRAAGGPVLGADGGHGSRRLVSP